MFLASEKHRQIGSATAAIKTAPKTRAKYFQNISIQFYFKFLSKYFFKIFINNFRNFCGYVSSAAKAECSLMLAVFVCVFMGMCVCRCGMRGLESRGYMALGVTADCVDCVGFLVRILLPLLRPLAPITARKLRKIRSILWLKGLASPPDNKQSRDSLQLMLRR